MTEQKGFVVNEQKFIIRTDCRDEVICGETAQDALIKFFNEINDGESVALRFAKTHGASIKEMCWIFNEVNEQDQIEELITMGPILFDNDYPAII